MWVTCIPAVIAMGSEIMRLSAWDNLLIIISTLSEISNN